MKAVNRDKFPYQDDAGWCRVHLDKKSLCNHKQGCWRKCPKLLEAYRAFRVNDAMRLSEIVKPEDHIFVVRSD